MIFFHVEMRNSDTHAILDAATRRRLNIAQDIKIGNHVWVGTRSTITKGSVISDDVIVAQGSLINKAYQEAQCVLAGTPARAVKQGVTRDRHLSAGA